MTPADLVTAWRERARELKPYAAPAAKAFTTAAAELVLTLDWLLPRGLPGRRVGPT
jgi:hypothetical protein